jgi:tight adherence protein C
MPDQMYLYLGVGGTFLAVVFGGVAWLVSARQRRPVQVLQNQLESAGLPAPPSMQVPLSERVVGPTASALANLALRLTPVGARDRLDQKLMLAGSPKGWTAERVLAIKGMTILIGLFSGWLVGDFVGGFVGRAVAMPIFGLMGYLVPGATLAQAGAARQERIRHSLADTVDLLTISVEAGLSFDAALLHVRRTMKGPLSEEIGRMLHEVQLGVSRSEALRHLVERVNAPELKGFVLAMVQADTFGVSVAGVLRAQSHELRMKRRQHAEERAMKIPVKLLFPMIGCVMPALFLVILGPAAIKIYDLLIRGIFAG